MKFFIAAKAAALLSLLVLSTKVDAQETNIHSTIVNVRTGQSVTRVNNSKGGWMYAYHPYEYRQDGARQNFRVEYLLDGYVRFVYWDNGSCVRTYESGIVDYDCDGFTGNDWLLLPTSTGAVQLQNKLTGTCMSIPSPSAVWSNLALATCVPAGSWVNPDQLWVISVQRGGATSEAPEPRLR